MNTLSFYLTYSHLQFVLDCSNAHEMTVYSNPEVNSKDNELEYITMIM